MGGLEPKLVLPPEYRRQHICFDNSSGPAAFCIKGIPIELRPGRRTYFVWKDEDPHENDVHFRRDKYGPGGYNALKRAEDYLAKCQIPGAGKSASNQNLHLSSGFEE